MRYGIPMTDIPLTTGQPDRGANAYQYTGLTIYDPLIAWELDVTDRPGKMIPGLATEWKVNEADKTLWTFKLRAGVKFHDGSAFDADAVIWNLEKVFNKDCPQFDTRQSAQVRPRLPGLLSYRKTGDMEIEIKTKSVDSLFPYQLLWFLVSSPAQWEKVGKDWNKFASEPAGTGPFKLARLVPRERAELVKNDAYWNPKRIPKVDRIVLDVRARGFRPQRRADLPGTVDMIDGPAPDMIDRLKQSGIRISTNITPHVFQYHPSLLEGSPWTDIRVRKAANLAIDRDAIVKLLNGLVTPAYGEVDRSSPWFGKPTFVLKYAPDEARKLMTEAGYSKAKPMKARISIQASGTNQTVNEAIQEMLKEVLLRHRVQAGRARGADDRLARRRQGGHEQGRLGDQRHPCDVRSVLRGQSLLRLGPGGAGRRQLELLQEPRDRQARGRDQEHLRSGQAGRDRGQDPRQGRRRRGDDLGLSRHHAACAVAQDQEVRPGPELVPGPGAVSM